MLTENYSIEQGEAGLTIAFSQPSGIKSDNDNQYILYFDTPVLLPTNPPTSISFEPESGSYTLLGSSTFIPKIFIKIKSTKRIQTKTLLRLRITDLQDNILYLDYIMIVCSPESVTSLNGTLLPSNNINGIGPNGGSIIQITESSSSSIYIGSTVTGPQIPNTPIVKVASIISNNLIELNQLISVDVTKPNSGIFVFKASFGCLDSTSLVENDSSTSYTVLDYSNNWTYKIRNQIIAQFIPENMENNLDSIVLLPIKNTSLLAPLNSIPPIPSICLLKAGGRVIKDTIPISNF